MGFTIRTRLALLTQALNFTIAEYSRKMLPLTPYDFASMKVYYNTTVGAPVNINTATEATITANQTVCYCEQNHLKFKIAIAVSDLPEGVAQL